MEKEFLPYELAVKLKEMGFNEWTMGIYIDGVLNVSSPSNFFFKVAASDGVVLNENLSEDAISAPLWQQAFDWFRDYHNAACCFNWHTKAKLVGEEFVFEEEKTTRKELINWAYEIDYYGSNFERELTDESDAGGFGFETYEKARLACLEKLIELVSLQKPCS